MSTKTTEEFFAVKKCTFVSKGNENLGQLSEPKPQTDPTSDWDAPPSGLTSRVNLEPAPGWPSLDEVGK